MGNLVIIRIEDQFFKNNSLNSSNIQQHRRSINSLIDLGFNVILVSSLSVERLIEIKDNLCILDSGYLIGLDGGQVYDVAKKRMIYDCYFKTRELPTLWQLIRRIDFDNMGRDLVIFHKKGNNLTYLSNESDLYKKVKNEYQVNKLDFKSAPEMPLNINTINKVSIELEDQRIDLWKDISSLSKLVGDFRFNVISNVLEILPYDATLTDAFNKIMKYDKSYRKEYNKDNIFVIGQENNDLEIFKLSNFNSTYEGASTNLKKNAQFVYFGTQDLLIVYSIEEIKKVLKTKRATQQ